jgi:hypothetical protein
MDAQRIEWECEFHLFGNGVLNHLALEGAYREIARVSKPGGKAFFMEPLNQRPLLVLFRKATPSNSEEQRWGLLF